MKLTSLLLVFISMNLLSFSQDNGSTNTLPKEQIVIPMVFHVIHGGGIENITDDQIIEAVKQMNEDYNAQTSGIEDVIPEFKDIVANIGINFALAKIDPEGNPTSGIERYYYPSLETSLNDRDIFMKDIFRWKVGKYMNVYVVRSSQGEAGSAYADGIGYEEGDDGIVISFWALGRTRTATPTHTKILTHEMGHWLGLGHTFSKDCAKDGDGIADTPPCIVGSGCHLYDTICGGLPNRQNFMDYASCTVMFTEGQKKYMLNVLDTTRHGRNKIGKLENQLATGVKGIPLNAEFYSTQIMTVPGNAIKFVDESFTEKEKISNWKWEFPGGVPNSFIGEIPPIVIYNNIGTYDVKLIITDQEGNVNVEDKKEYINVQKDVYMQTANFFVDDIKFYDPGYKGKYGCRTDLILTLSPKTEGKLIQSIFNRFEMDPLGRDYLKIYNGIDTTELVGSYFGYDNPGIITSTHSSGALTFVFHSDVEYRHQGWEADVVEIDKSDLPIAKIFCPTKTVNTNSEVTFLNLSQGFQNSYVWKFPGGIPSSSKEVNPAVKYKKPGKYRVELAVKNRAGNDKLVLKEYVYVEEGLVLPYLMDFEGDFSTPDWGILSDCSIIITSKVDYIGYQSESCLMIDNNNDSCNEVFVLPAFDLSSIKNCRLSYDYAYTKFNDKSRCSIRILASVDNGVNWKKVAERNQDDLETVDINWIHSSGWLPKNDSEWREESIKLSEFVGNKYLLIKVESTTEYDTNIWIDNIAVTGN